MNIREANKNKQETQIRTSRREVIILSRRWEVNEVPEEKQRAVIVGEIGSPVMARPSAN